VLKDPDMLKRLNGIEKMGFTKKGHVLFSLHTSIYDINRCREACRHTTLAYMLKNRN